MSSGSACSSNHPAISGTLKAIGVEKKYLDATLRFSFSFDTTQKDIDDCIDALKSIVPVLRRFTPGEEDKMMFKAFLIKYGEIGLKGKNRYLFEDALMRQIRFALNGTGNLR